MLWVRWVLRMFRMLRLVRVLLLIRHDGDLLVTRLGLLKLDLEVQVRPLDRALEVF